MKNPFELAPLVVAAIIGAATFYLIKPASDTDTATTTLMTGAGIGLAVQIGVRLTGVS